MGRSSVPGRTQNSTKLLRATGAGLLVAACAGTNDGTDSRTGTEAGSPPDTGAHTGSGGGCPIETGGSGGASTLPADAAVGTGGTNGSAGEGGSSGMAAASGTSGDSGAGGAEADAGTETRCSVTPTTVECPTKSIVTVTNGADSRRIYWTDPIGQAPPAGWPAVVLYQGSFFGPSLTWNTSLARGTTPFGGDVQVEIVAKLSARGYVVVQPEAPGGIAWNTNSSGDYAVSADAVFIPQLLDRIAHGTFGPVDTTRLYATGISSGGYMTSRMAVSYPGRFRALAIQSGSYATCLGPICTVPATLPADHPPTLFLHGGADATVPIGTAKDYDAKLRASGITTEFVEDPTAGHRWLVAAPDAILKWFADH